MTGFHAKKSPSGAKRLHNCKGALALLDSLPAEMRTGSSAAARAGTAAHFLLEKCLSEIKRPSEFEDRIIVIIVDKVTGEETGCSMLRPAAKLPKKPEERERAFLVDVEMISNVDIAYDYVESRCAELGIPMDKLQLETRTNPVPDRDDTSGTADVTIDAWPTCLEVVDYKNGRLVVEHEDNPQILAYLAGRAHDTGWDHDEYRIAVVQPNGRHEEGKVRPITVTKERLRRFVDEHRAAAEASDEAALKFDEVGCDLNANVGEAPDVTWGQLYLKAGDHCDFCDAWSICPANKAMRAMQAQMDFDEPVDNLPPLVIESIAEAQSIMERAGYLSNMVKAASRLLYENAKAGRMPEGMKWVRKRSKRQFKPDENGLAIPAAELADKLVAAGHFNANERARLFVPESLLTGPQIEKLVPAKQRKAYAEAFLHKPPGGLKLVPLSDPGEAVVLEVGADFDDDEEDEADDY